jgi:hypothetical protein
MKAKLAVVVLFGLSFHFFHFSFQNCTVRNVSCFELLEYLDSQIELLIKLRSSCLHFVPVDIGAHGWPVSCIRENETAANHLGRSLSRFIRSERA